MGLVPKLTEAELPACLSGLTALGLSKARVAILVALADLGGEARTADLVQRTAILKPTLLAALNDLERSGYVSASLPAEERRRGVALSWEVNHIAIERDLRSLSAATRPGGRDRR